MDEHDVPVKYRPMRQRALTGKSRRAAIRLFCLQCTGWSEAAVKTCPATGCPLHSYRLGAPSPQDACQTTP